MEAFPITASDKETPPQPLHLPPPPPRQPAGNWLTALRHEKNAAAELAMERLRTRPVFTIGHSNHGWDTFLGMLRGQGITDLVDVRSRPFSRFAPWSRREELGDRLVNELIDYHFIGGQLGGKPGDPKLYDAQGVPVYERFREREAYKAGLARLLWLIARKDVVCLMCAEEDPTHCHRKLLIAPDLAEYRVKVSHIRAARS